MLQAIRDKAQGWIAWVIVVLITIPFALFGIQEYLGNSADPSVASINGTEITQRQLDNRVRDFRESMRIRLGASYSADMFPDELIKQQVLDGMINESLLQQATTDWNMRSSDEQTRAYIQSIPSFQTDGRFDQRIYKSAVRNRGMNSAGFEAAVRQEMVANQLRNGISNSSFVTDKTLLEQVRLSDQKRDIRYLRVPASSFNKADQVTEEQARKFYEENQADYQVPERVKLAYILLSSDALTQLVEVDEDKLRTYFDENQNSFIADEERRIRHILVASGSDDDAARAKAQSLLEKIRAGAEFSDIAKDSDDPGSAANGGDLGWVNKGVMVKPFEESAFSLAKDELSGLVKSKFGYHIIQVTGIRGGSEAGFDELRAQVETAYRKREAEDLYFNYVERLTDAAYETPDNLSSVAEEMALNLEMTDWVTQSSTLKGSMSSPKVINAAFSEDVLQRGNNSDLIELGTTESIVLRVQQHEVSTVRPFVDVSDDVMKKTAAAQASEQAVSTGESLLKRLRDGADLAEISAEKAWSLETTEKVARNQSNVPAEIVEAAFSVRPATVGVKTYTGVVSAEGDYFVISVDAIHYGDMSTLDDTAQQSRREQLQGNLGRNEFVKETQLLRERALIELPGS